MFASRLLAYAFERDCQNETCHESRARCTVAGRLGLRRRRYQLNGDRRWRLERLRHFWGYGRVDVDYIGHVDDDHHRLRKRIRRDELLGCDDRLAR